MVTRFARWYFASDFCIEYAFEDVAWYPFQVVIFSLDGIDSELTEKLVLDPRKKLDSLSDNYVSFVSFLFEF